MATSELFKDAIDVPHNQVADGLLDGVLFGESPRYHDGKFYFSDFPGCTIYTIEERTKTKSTYLKVSHRPNGMCFVPGREELIYSSMFDGKLYHCPPDKPEESELYADLSPLIRGYCGDMVIDRRGRVYVDDIGSRIEHGEERALGRVLMVDTDKTVRIVAEDLDFPNGIAIDTKGTTMYLSESGGNRLNAINIDSETGNLSNRRTLFDLSVLGGGPHVHGVDGLCIDAEDGLWLSLLDHHCFVRRDVNGRFTHIIRVGRDSHPTACYIGGEDGQTLFLVTNYMPGSQGVVPEGHSIAEEVGKKTTRCRISVAKAPVARGLGLP